MLVALESELHSGPDGVDGCEPWDLLALLPQASTWTPTSQGVGPSWWLPRELETPQEQGRVWRVSVAGGWQVSISVETCVEVSFVALELVSESRS